MEIIEKQVEKVKEVPYDGYGYYPTLSFCLIYKYSI